MGCPVCGGSRLQSLTTPVGERLYCGNCFHGWRTRAPEFSYSTVAMCALGTSRQRLEAQVRFFAPFLPDGGSILEIGCATGELAATTRKLLPVGAYEGIELSPARERARPYLTELHQEPLRELQKRGALPRQFDLVVMSHVLEHIDDIRAEAAAIRRQIKQGGAVFIEVPNRSGHPRLPIDDNRSHLHFFSATSLVNLLADEGLETIATATDAWLDARYADSLRVIARPFQIPDWAAGFLSNHSLIRDEPSIVVWGAGSLASEVLANFFDPAKIDFFVDKDSAKWGTTMLGHAVRPPEALGHTPRTVLLNSVDYAAEIAADVQAMYPEVDHRLVPIGDLF